MGYRIGAALGLALAATAAAAQAPTPGAAAPAPAAAAPAPAPPSGDVKKVLDCMRGNMPQTVRIQTVEIKAVDRAGGERTLKGKLYGTREKDRVRVNVRVEAPQDLAGAAYLVREGEKSDEMYIYLPALRKTRRVTGASVDGQLWGTDLSYNDVKQIQNAFDGSEGKLEPVEQVEGRPVHVMSFVPRKADGSRYSLIRAHVDQQTCVALKVAFHEGATVRKTIDVPVASLKQSGKHWYGAEALIKDLKENTHTKMTVLGVSSGDPLAARFFNPTTFYLAR